MKLANRRPLIRGPYESLIFSVSGAQHAGAHSTHSKRITESRDSGGMIADYANSALRVSVEKYP